MCVCVWPCGYGCPLMPIKGVRSSGIAVTDAYEPPSVGVGN